MQKLGLKLWSTNTDAYYEAAKRLYPQFDYIELYIVPDTLETLDKWRALEIPFIIHAPHFAHGFNLADKGKHRSNKEIYQQVKEFADDLDAEYIIFHGGIDGDAQETARQLAAINEPRALIENKPFRALLNKSGGRFCRGYNPDEIKTIQQAVGCGFCLDFGHAICAGNSLKKDLLPEFLKLNPDMFHLTDFAGGECDSHLHFGTGVLDIKRLLQMTPENTKITIETVKNSKENLDDFIEDIKWLRN